jgi:DNA replication protein DnaC
VATLLRSAEVNDVRTLHREGLSISAISRLAEEAEARRARYLLTRTRLAHLPYHKSFAQFDFSFQPSIDKRQIRELQTLRFLHEASNVIFLGPPGVGKTHLAVALALKAIECGSGAHFITAHDLVLSKVNYAL